MKKMKLLLTAFGVFAVVGSALALKARINPNLLICNTSTGLCRAPITDAEKYHTTTGTPQANPGFLYQGQVGQRCTGANPPCPQYTATTVFKNI